jgi:hypothetical protein
MSLDRSAWIKLEADDYAAVVSSSSIAVNASYGFLAGQVESELSQEARSAAVRLDCSSDVAKEIVQLLRLGPAHYTAPSDPRLLRALQHQLDDLGISCSSVGSHHVPDSQEVLQVPAYLTPAMSGSKQQSGALPVYSNRARGWALKTAEQDSHLQGMTSSSSSLDGFSGSSMKAAVLRAESTGAGEWAGCNCSFKLLLGTQFQVNVQAKVCRLQMMRAAAAVFGQLTA